MDFNLFSEKIINSLKSRMGEEYVVRTKEVMKNNDVRLHALMVSKADSNIAPTMYLEPLYEDYQEGVPLSSILDELVVAFEENSIDSFDLEEDFLEFDRIKDKICYRIVGRRENGRILQECPYIEYLDLIICFFCHVDSNQIGAGTILIENRLMERWGVTTDDLYNAAKVNTQRLYLPEIIDIDRFLWQLRPMEAAYTDGFMRIVTNRQRVHGATCMLYGDIIQTLSEQYGGDYYIIPSSVHEIITLPIDSDPTYLREIISEVNRTEVSPVDVLSDSLYMYDSDKKVIRLA